MSSAVATIERIYFDDEVTCSSRFISATLKLPSGKSQYVEMIRETNPLFTDKFDNFWNKAKEFGFKNLVGKRVELSWNPTFDGFGYSIMSWLD